MGGGKKKDKIKNKKHKKVGERKNARATKGEGLTVVRGVTQRNSPEEA